MQGLLSLTAASSGAIKAVVLFPRPHPVTCLHRLVSVLGVWIYSRGQRTDGRTVDSQGVRGLRQDDTGIEPGIKTSRLVEPPPPPVARMRSHELLPAFNGEIVIACGSFITLEGSSQNRVVARRAGEAKPGPVFMFYFQERVGVCALNAMSERLLLRMSMRLHSASSVSFIKHFKLRSPRWRCHLQI